MRGEGIFQSDAEPESKQHWPERCPERFQDAEGGRKSFQRRGHLSDQCGTRIKTALAGKMPGNVSREGASFRPMRNPNQNSIGRKDARKDFGTRKAAGNHSREGGIFPTNAEPKWR